MEKYQQELQKINSVFDEDDLRLGKKLADGTYNGHRGYVFEIFSLKQSTYNTDEVFKQFNKNRKVFWEKLYKLSEDDLKVYFNALKEYCCYMGIE